MLDEYVPPVKRLKLHTTEHFWLKDKNNNKENIDPQCPELCQNRIVRKRKIPMRRRNQPSLLTLSTSVLLEIVDYLSLTGLSLVLIHQTVDFNNFMKSYLFICFLFDFYFSVCFFVCFFVLCCDYLSFISILFHRRFRFVQCS